MSFRPDNDSHPVRLNKLIRLISTMLLVLALGACTSQAAREAELAAQEAQRVAAEQETARIAEQQQSARAAELARQREAQAAERARLQEERDRQVAAAAARAEEEQRQQEEAARREQARVAAIAAAEAERQEKLERITQLEQQIATIQANVSNDETATAVLREAILVAEELLEILSAEQAKYENTDATGYTVEPLAKDLIAELEARKDSLVRQIQSQ
jgi:fused signal recognition particle receptor